MECRRCQGEMVEAHFFDRELAKGIMWMRGWRCQACGHAIDPLREANRLLRQAIARMEKEPPSSHLHDGGLHTEYYHGEHPHHR